ncbi:protein SAWADEE HOMEODOMAIN HOMOLOG 2 [Ziziphus jujuba]|uniref:Protein SAWADEE HOMEODOMAIN HOMOLOG 2 n=1 Tax=Ziziphus jujuba TaxID=326968 RepID=A0A6P4ARJ1_ZIZJJ|nr:protein SAWADEE HOMEODOMAIN HOMOLOG 2 [Ziziphus jujuba]
MGRPPSNGGPAFRFTPAEVSEMETVLQEHNNTMPAREVLVGLADKFSGSADRKGKITVQMKQVWNWFQNRRYAIRAKTSKNPGKLNVSPMPRDDSTPVRAVPQPISAPLPAPSVPGTGRGTPENSVMEFEAKSGRDGAWYDVSNFLSHRYLESGDPEVLVRFSGFGPEEDEWVNIRKHVRQRSLPCESSECVAVLPGDLILCFQEGKEQALYFDAHVLDAQRRRHDVRGCRCRFLVRYDHDQSEEIVPLRKVCRRPETDYRLQQLHAVNEAASAEQQKSNMDPFTVSGLRAAITPAETMQKQQIVEAAPAVPVLHPNSSLTTQAPVLEPKKAETSIAVSMGNSNVPPVGKTITNSTVTSTVPGGSVTSTVPGGSVTSTVPGGSVTSTGPGGTVTSAIPGGTVTSTVPGGTVTSTTPGGTVTIPGGTVVSTIPVGTVMSSIPSGTVTSTFSGGTVTSTVPGGTGTSNIPGGTVTSTVLSGSIASTVPGSSGVTVPGSSGETMSEGR